MGRNTFFVSHLSHSKLENSIAVRNELRACTGSNVWCQAYSPLGGGSASNAAKNSDGELDGTRWVCIVYDQQTDVPVAGPQVAADSPLDAESFRRNWQDACTSSTSVGTSAGAQRFHLFVSFCRNEFTFHASHGITFIFFMNTRVVSIWCHGMSWLSQDFMIIPRSSKPERIRQNFDIFDFELSEEHMQSISASWQHFVHRVIAVLFT